MQISDPKPNFEPSKVVSRHCTVLQVEDNEANATVVKMLIGRRSDLALLTAVSGSQGIEMAIAHQPDVILLDISLPDMSGYEALAALRANPLLSGVPVIALSSYAYRNQIQEGLEAGFFRYLTKPYKLDELMRTIDLALGIVSAASATAQ